MKAQETKSKVKKNDDFSIIPDYLKKKFSNDTKRLEALREVLLQQKSIGEIVHQHRIRSNGGVPIPVDSSKPVDLIKYRYVDARIRPPIAQWFILQDWTIKLCAWTQDFKALDNVVMFKRCPEEFIQRYADRVWRGNYPGCKKTIYIFKDESSTPFMMASNYEKFERKPINDQTEIE